MIQWLIVLAVGKLLIYLWQIFPLPKPVNDIKLIKKLHDCDLCSGVWIYGILSYFFHLDLLGEIGFPYIPFLTELITGGNLSFVVHLIHLGWVTKFSVTIVE